MRHIIAFGSRVLLLLAAIVLTLVAPGCCGAPRCSPCCAVMPPAYCQPRYSEPQWQYLDREGSRRLMGDSAFRDHLGLQSQPPASQ